MNDTDVKQEKACSVMLVTERVASPAWVRGRNNLGGLRIRWGKDGVLADRGGGSVQ